MQSKRAATADRFVVHVRREHDHALGARLPHQGRAVVDAGDLQQSGRLEVGAGRPAQALEHDFRERVDGRCTSGCASTASVVSLNGRRRSAPCRLAAVSASTSKKDSTTEVMTAAMPYERVVASVNATHAHAPMLVHAARATFRLADSSKRPSTISTPCTNIKAAIAINSGSDPAKPGPSIGTSSEGVAIASAMALSAAMPNPQPSA